MVDAFSYRPRFRDMRIKPPKPDQAEPDERVCDAPDCSAPGVCRAPVSPGNRTEFYWFCPAHAAEYNKNWDFFADMDETAAAAYQAGAATGHRPTWSMNGGGRFRTARDGVRASARARAAAGGDWSNVFDDTMGLFGEPPSKRTEDAPKGRRLGKLERRALETLGLEVDAEPDAARQRYTELVKALHPDANGGDRSTEARLTEVIRAFKTLRKAGFV